MELVLEMARKNVECSQAGPFAAAVFEQKSGKLIAPGVNMVLSTCCSSAHAEIIALSLAQQIRANFEPNAKGLEDCELVTSTEPCSMCMGAVIWSGVGALVCGARDEDAQAIGFDEGPKPSDWPKSLEERSISVLRDVQREQAVSVLRHYKKIGGVIY